MDKFTLAKVTALIALLLIGASLVAFWAVGTFNIVVAILFLSSLIFLALTIYLFALILAELPLNIAKAVAALK